MDKFFVVTIHKNKIAKRIASLIFPRNDTQKLFRHSSFMLFNYKTIKFKQIPNNKLKH